MSAHEWIPTRNPTREICPHCNNQRSLLSDGRYLYWLFGCPPTSRTVDDKPPSWTQWEIPPCIGEQIRLFPEPQEEQEP